MRHIHIHNYRTYNVQNIVSCDMMIITHNVRARNCISYAQQCALYIWIPYNVRDAPNVVYMILGVINANLNRQTYYYNKAYTHVYNAPKNLAI